MPFVERGMRYMKIVKITWDDDNNFNFSYEGVDRPSQVLTMVNKCMSNVRRLMLQGKTLNNVNGEIVCQSKKRMSK